jgi:squalene synthase HpnC
MALPHHGVDHYENFPVASILCPPHLRPAVRALYQFARTADDLADEGQASATERLQALTQFAEDLNACAAGRQGSGRWPAVFDSLAPILHHFKLPVPLLHDLLSAFKQDVVHTPYESQAQVLDYCRRSANPVGRLLLHLYGLQEESALERSDAICTSLQLINFWQDLSEDLTRGRCYLPADLMAAHRVTQDDLKDRRDTAATQSVLQAAVGWARTLMHRGAPLVRQVPGRAGWELRLVIQGGLRVADRTEALGTRILRQRPTLALADLGPVVWRSLRM